MALILLIGITLLGVVGFVLWQFTFAQPPNTPVTLDQTSLSADQIVEQSVITETITTNLYTQEFAVVQFNVILDSKKTKEEFEKRSMQARSIIISVLSSMRPDDLRGAEGKDKLEATLIQQFNDILQSGNVISVLTIDLKIQ